MRRNLRSHNTTPRRQDDRDIPTVPTFQPAIETSALQTPIPAATEDDPSEEAVRRMVEAAYT
jgi:hypothetical protein